MSTNQSHAGHQLEWRSTQDAAAALGLTAQYLPIPNVPDVEAALAAAQRGRCEALMVFPDAGMTRHCERIADFAVQQHMPAMSGWAEFARRGSPLTYGPERGAALRRLAHYVDRILKGARPADLPVEQPTVVQLVVNLKTARDLGVKLPQTLRLRADEVIQ